MRVKENETFASVFALKPEPPLGKNAINSASDDVYVRKCAAQSGEPTREGHQKGNEDDARFLNSVIQEDADGHKCRCGSSDLKMLLWMSAPNVFDK